MIDLRKKSINEDWDTIVYHKTPKIKQTKGKECIQTHELVLRAEYKKFPGELGFFQIPVCILFPIYTPKGTIIEKLYTCKNCGIDSIVREVK